MAQSTKAAAPTWCALADPIAPILFAHFLIRNYLFDNKKDFPAWHGIRQFSRAQSDNGDKG
ncbi:MULTISPECIES: hypothetical protein [unclassified Halomonas]|uniref:hypothetical protein n=1 Tax=unclassified Halomonas TaxID=2609666 RepID=UPI001EF526D3|nr:MULTISPECIES: hypothetical protein [unclassified Halomonas]MCP1343686.1 hypothetical protein [Halomonas sp. FL8]MCP1361929.1 hypothetical protein [Halomonas sp. BBD45]MCP1367392.1 hypothetical protein [Halomonas sp. BBD48]